MVNVESLVPMVSPKLFNLSTKPPGIQKKWAPQYDINHKRFKYLTNGHHEIDLNLNA